MHIKKLKRREESQPLPSQEEERKNYPMQSLEQGSTARIYKYNLAPYQHEALSYEPILQGGFQKMETLQVMSLWS